jgi:hypothetical protein
MATGVFTHKQGISYSSDEGQVVGVTNTYTGNTEEGWEGNVSANATQEIDIAWVNAKVQSLMLYSSTAAVIKSNNSGSTAGNTISLTAKQLIAWSPDHLEQNPFHSADVTKLFAIAGAAIANVKVRVLLQV